MASHAAARRAVEAGYTDVSVMVDGIEGWKAAGMQAASVQ
jgi:rhodanese-related sulfurtransferase